VNRRGSLSLFIRVKMWPNMLLCKTHHPLVYGLFAGFLGVPVEMLCVGVLAS